MVGTQPVQRWPGSIRVLRLQPLERSQTEDFLVAQEIQRGQVREFLNGALTQQNARDLEASRLVLSNPFDLTVIGDMLKGGLTPNLLTLPGAAIPDDGGDVPGEEAIEFPLGQFADYVYGILLAGTGYLDISTPRTLAVSSANGQGKNGSRARWPLYVRHDKIRDYFLVDALMRDDRLTAHYGDLRFFSAYLSLALKLPLNQAIALREDLEEWALDHEDRSLADELRMAMRRRKDSPILTNL